MSAVDRRKAGRVAGIAGAIACTTVFALTIGLTYPLLAFVLEAQGYGETAIGFNAAMTPLGILVASPFYPQIVKRFGAWQVAVACLIAVAVLIFLMGLTQLYAAFLVLRFLLGFADTGVFIISETWINQLAEKKSRGRIIGLYATMLSAGFGAGPLILSFTGVTGLTPFVIGAGLCLAAAFVIFKIRASMPDSSHEQASSSLTFVRLAPTLLIAIATFAFWDGALLSLFPIYGLGFDLSASFITLALSVCILGNTFLQIPIGWAADITSRRVVMIVCASAAALGAIALPATIGSPILFLSTLFFWGAAVGGIYTMAMSELGDRFAGAELVAGNAAFAIAFGIGGMIGGPVTGAAMDVAGANGFTTTFALVFFATAVFAAWRHVGSRWF